MSENKIGIINEEELEKVSGGMIRDPSISCGLCGHLLIIEENDGEDRIVCSNPDCPNSQKSAR